MKKSSVIILTIVSTAILLSIVQAILSNMLSTSGVLMSKVNREIQEYRRENAIIREKLFATGSLNNIAAKAEKLGFAEDKSQLVLTTSSLAVRQ